MKRYDIIRHLIEQRGYKSYLEIGVLENETFNNVPLDVKHGVDPNGCGTHTMTSDEFFANHCEQSYDIIFIDGLHLAEQVTKDIENSLTHLNSGGIIVVHDVLPEQEWQQNETGISGKPWVGTVWHAIADLRCERDDVSICTIDTDWGCCLIKRGVQIPYIKDVVAWTWEYFLEHKLQLLNVISPEQFLCELHD